jgi:hypothetical protein
VLAFVWVTSGQLLAEGQARTLMEKAQAGGTSQGAEVKLSRMHIAQQVTGMS